MRLINADELMRAVELAENSMEQHGQEFSFSFMSSGQEVSTEWYYVEDLIEQAETIDAVPVVRCKDCIYRDYILCPLLNLNEDEDYCSLGERKE